MPTVVYVLTGKTSGRRYVGITGNLPRRLAQHRNGSTKAGQLLKDFVLVHTEELADRKQARERERFLKSGQGRKWLDMVLAKADNENPPEGCPSG